MSIIELSVSGKKSIELELERRPESVRVFFDDSYIDIPCNPGHTDMLEYFIREREGGKQHRRRPHRKYFLEVSWDVAEPRLIKCHITY